MNNIYIRFLFFLLTYASIGVFPIIHAQQPPKNRGMLMGRVVYANGAPVDMATVVIRSLNRHTSTDEKGMFRLENLALGKEYVVEVIPFGGQSVQVKADLRRKSTELFVRLKYDEAITLSQVEVLGKSKGRQSKDQGYAMNVISTKDVLMQNIQTTELLGRSAGIKIRQSAGMGSDISFNLNGLSGNSVRIFIDGIPIRNYGRSFSLSSIPPSMIERIEVYKGVLPAELSEDALGGGINVVLKKDMRSNIMTSYSYGSFNTHQWDLNASHRDKETGFLATLSSFYNVTDNNYKVWGENVYVTNPITGEYTHVKAERFHDKYYSSGIKSNFGFTRKKWADEFLLGFMFSEMERDIQTGATMEVVYGNRRTEYKTAMGNFQYKKNDLFVNGLDVSAFVTYSKTYRQLIDTVPYVYNWKGEIARGYNNQLLKWQSGAEGDSPTLATNDERNLANRLNAHYHIHKNHLIGVSYFLGTFIRQIDDPLLPEDIRNLLDERKYHKKITSFNYDVNLFDDKLKSSLFYKIYSQQVSLTEFIRTRNPNGTIVVNNVKHNNKVNDQGYGFTLSYALTPKIIVSLSGEKSIRLPESTELLGNTSQGVSPSLGLKPEYSNNLNAGINFRDFSFGKHQLGAEMNFFVRDINDMIVRGVPRPSDDFFRFENLGKIISKGIDVELRYIWDKHLIFNGNVSYFNALFNLEFSPDTGLRYAHYRNRLRNAPYFTANANVEYIFKGIIQEKSQVSFNYNFSYTHEFFKEWEAYGAVGKIIIPSQPLHDLGITYSFPNRKWILAFNAKNIFDTQVFDNFALQKPGRSIFGKITYTIF
ncbi:TonB-dependent receptor [Capnocytophaga canis]|uniref:TonB-dependent receptor n=1 Tax=Capnocytophaga canis TaxID=1848903 RepID=A0A0B7I1N9_9FLAO|nr:TonB-dependent receptor [Capnocytophaga canis]CEN45886.1 TonB-dependent receptor [Capnocytophaga canis]CEN46187.1 TonB-dependent receptor [Capnocytophaga canis]